MLKFSLPDLTLVLVLYHCHSLAAASVHSLSLSPSLCISLGAAATLKLSNEPSARH